jgi:D-alanyl-lipoteichoic acid acyltransferase DltB (MBOAT superfamily)
MAFNSIDYLVFLLVALAILHLAPQGLKTLWILACSYFFYAQWNQYYLILIIASTVVDFICAKGIHKAQSSHTSTGVDNTASATKLTTDRNNTFGENIHGEYPLRQKIWLSISIISNLGLLFTFKYLGFFSQMALDLSNLLGRPLYFKPFELLLPVGISFYTLQTLSYTLDVYRKEIKPETSILRFATYVSFFPQLVAGPIEKAGHLCPQLIQISRPTQIELSSGCRRILWGLLKKVVIADRLSMVVQSTFFHHHNPDPSTIFIAAILANVLIYADFSAYSDIAIGSARLMGIHLRENFNFPLFSRSMPDFWKRWHISLHHFFIDYVYAPLGGRKVSWLRWNFNIAIIFLISGLWHGAAWNFIVWSIYHFGLVLIHIHVIKALKLLGLSSWIQPKSSPSRNLLHLGQISLVHLQRGLSMILFFIPDVEKGLSYLYKAISGPWSTSLSQVLPFSNLINLLFFIGFLGLMLTEGLHLKRAWSLRLKTMPRPCRWGIYQLTFFAIVIFGVETNNPFIYFQF